jgi:hypothetical protein
MPPVTAIMSQASAVESRNLFNEMLNVSILRERAQIALQILQPEKQ